ncbi:MAG: hypothetical protein KatS3mg038_1048 [Candidatus Kapaibacterium sp.]|nr:MAG: hypothetical protein KatS3mg038_1048 [Candidatus Kapabacteria bacterium]
MARGALCARGTILWYNVAKVGCGLTSILLCLEKEVRLWRFGLVIVALLASSGRQAFIRTKWYDSNPYLTRYVIPGTRRASIHTGVDLQRARNADASQPVHSIADGTVIFAGRGHGTWGNVVVIRHERCYSRYAHLEGVRVRKGDKLSCGDTFAVIGKSGMAYVNQGEHLHFDLSHTEILGANPLHWPGANYDMVRHNYFNPTLFLFSPSDTALCLAIPHVRVRAEPSLGARIIGRLERDKLVPFSCVVDGKDGNKWLQLHPSGFAMANWFVW